MTEKKYETIEDRITRRTELLVEIRKAAMELMFLECCRVEFNVAGIWDSSDQGCLDLKVEWDDSRYR